MFELVWLGMFKSRVRLCYNVWLACVITGNGKTRVKVGRKIRVELKLAKGGLRLRLILVLRNSQIR